MGALSPEGVTVRGLAPASSQGDRAVLNILAAMGARISVENDAVTVRRGELNSVAIDAGPIPDLIPVLSVAAAGAVGDTHIFNAGRLRLKESDRLRTTAQLLTALGGSVEEQPSGLIVHGSRPSHRRHRRRLRRPSHRHVRRCGGVHLRKRRFRQRQRMRFQILSPVLGGSGRFERRSLMSQYGEHLRLTIFGQSHAPAIGMTLEGLPAGEAIDMEALQAFLNRRAPGQNAWSTPRKEADAPEFLSGLVEQCHLRRTPYRHHPQHQHPLRGLRQSCAWSPAPATPTTPPQVKYGGHQDYAGGGAFSGRLTAPLCIAGGICLQLLEKRGISVISRIAVHRNGGGY